MANTDETCLKEAFEAFKSLEKGIQAPELTALVRAAGLIHMEQLTETDVVIIFKRLDRKRENALQFQQFVRACHEIAKAKQIQDSSLAQRFAEQARIRAAASSGTSTGLAVGTGGGTTAGAIVGPGTPAAGNSGSVPPAAPHEVWQKKKATQGKFYWVHGATGESTYTKPKGWLEPWERGPAGTHTKAATSAPAPAPAPASAPAPAPAPAAPVAESTPTVEQLTPNELWLKKKATQGKFYWVHRTSGESTYKKPQGWLEPWELATKSTNAAASASASASTSAAAAAAAAAGRGSGGGDDDDEDEDEMDDMGTLDTAVTAGAGAAGGSAGPGTGTAAGGGGGLEGGEVPLRRKFTHSGGRKVGIEDFDLLKVLGVGSYGKVMLVRKKENGVVYAMKTLQKENLIKQDQLVHTQAEHDIAFGLNHPFLVNLAFAFQTHVKLYLVLEYMPGGELFFWLRKARRFSVDRVRLCAAEVILALEFLHKNNVVYRDLKPENVMVDAEGHMRITDFGLAKQNVVSMTDGARTFCGTPEYLAPEQVAGWGHGQGVDWWGVGVFMFELLNGVPPFSGRNASQINQKIMKAHEAIRWPSFFLEADYKTAKDCITQFMQKKVQDRLGCGRRGASEIKHHPYFKGLNWNKVLRKEYAPEVVPTTETDGAAVNFDKEFTDQTARDSFTETSAAFEGFEFDLKS